MKKCRHCKTEIDNKAKICPSCRKKQTNPLVRGIMIFLGLMIIIGGLSSLVGDGEEVQKKQQEKYSFIEEPKLEEEGSDPFKMKYIVGTIKNNTSKKTSYVQVVFNLYDEDNNVIGSAMDNINHIESDGTWKFKAMILEDEFDSFKFESVTGF